MNKLFDAVNSLFESGNTSFLGEDSSKATILDFEETGGGVLNYVGEIDNYNFVGEINGIVEFFDKKWGINSWEAYESIEDEAYSSWSNAESPEAYQGKYGYDIQGAYDFEQKYTEFKPEYLPAVAEALKVYADNNISNSSYASQVYEEVDRLNSYDFSLEESIFISEAGKSTITPPKAFIEVYSNCYDGMGDWEGTYDYAITLADSYGIDYDEDSIDDFESVEGLLSKAINTIYLQDRDSFKDEVDNLIEYLDADYLADTLERKQGVIECFNVLKGFTSNPGKIDEILSQLQGVNIDIRLVAQEFQRYFHDNYKPWEFLGTTTGPRTYNDLFDCSTDYSVVSADYFNYAGRPSDMLDHIGYGWKQTDNGVQADLIGFKNSVKGSSAVYDQPPVTYGYSVVIDNSNKEEKFKEMGDVLASKAKEIKSKYHLGDK